MKKLSILYIILSICLFVFAQLADAQVVIDYEQLKASQNVRLRVFLQDDETEQPIGFASVYLTSPGDSTIVYFAVSDEKGEAVVKDIVPGEYEITAEMIGYLPYKATKKLKGWEVNLGAISMKEDKELLKAAKISASGNAVMVKGDTLVYNASAYNVGENAMLEDLLKKMPGMEVDKDGNVTVGGEKVDRITVGGKTFFFDDPKMALKNLPAKIVEKISVVDKDKKEAEFTGVSSKDDKEKVMDVGLKEEYSKGWFGNATAKGGTTLMTKNETTPKDIIEPVYNASTMVAGYNEKDQITFLANGKNVETGGAFFFNFSGDDLDDFAYRTGQTTSAQGGVNYNTERITGFDTNVSANYTFSRKDAKERSTRTSFMPEGDDMLTSSQYNGIGSDHKVTVNFQLDKKESQKFMFNFRPSFSFNRSKRDIVSHANTSEAEVEKNKTVSTNASESDMYSGNLAMTLGVKKLGKNRRSLTLNLEGLYNGVNGSSAERLNMKYVSSQETRNLNYLNERSYLFGTARLSYVEPFGENWSIMARASVDYTGKKSDRMATDADTGLENSYYSSFSDNQDLAFSESVMMQYRKDRSNVSLGVVLSEQKNVIYTRTLGIENKTGVDEWILNWSPRAEIRHSFNNLRVNIYASGMSDTPSGNDIIPILNITDPLQITTGNIYLRPEFQYYFNGYLSHNNPKTQTYTGFYLNANLTTRDRVYASWFDDKGVRYAIPVNSLKPGTSIYTGFSSNIPLDKQKNLTLKLSGTFSFHNGVSYQAKGIFDGLDRENFDYASVMEDFWGDVSGSRFYSGESGFAESQTRRFNYSLNLGFQYKLDDFTINLGGYGLNEISRYTLDPKANINTWNFNINGDFIWTGDNGWEIKTDAKYNFYRGYSNGYGLPEFIWNASVSKSVKAFTISLSACDILNQRKMLSRSVTSGYMQDTYKNIIGRCVLVGLTFNFGKMNAKNNRNVQNAVYQMMY